MAITTLESQRRNFVVLLDSTRPCNPPPPPGAGAVVGVGDPSAILLDHPRRVLACQVRWESAQTVRRRRLDAAERAFLDARHGRSTPALFTHLSRFPSRTLPPPGVRACNLDATDSKVFMIGDMVRVRRFKVGPERPSWTGWQRGQVLLYLPMRSFLGNFGHAYYVRVVSQSGKAAIEQYVQFIGEICAEDDQEVEENSLTPEECAKMRYKANYIYTRIHPSKKLSGVPHKDVWTPAEVLTYEDGENVFVRSLAGPTAGQKMYVKDALPYTLETAVACRKQSQDVLGPSGKLFLPDMPLKPLHEKLPETLPQSIFNLPSPSTLVANPVLRHPSSQK
ncbi:hypothetical protein C8R44DRAFT_896062 [Mycena epipterygia]|nr:hypothetical protein C8R44DRAFT_896062 [Mycena epipterygia]